MQASPEGTTGIHFVPVQKPTNLIQLTTTALDNLMAFQVPYLFADYYIHGYNVTNTNN